MTLVGVDVDRSMLDRARRAAPAIEWVEHDLTTLDLGRTFSVVVMAGNVPLFTPPGTHAALVAGCARHVSPGGALVSGFQLGRGYDLDAYDEHCRAAGLALADRSRPGTASCSAGGALRSACNAAPELLAVLGLHFDYRDISDRS
jgi:hypothetical protein